MVLITSNRYKHLWENERFTAQSNLAKFSQILLNLVKYRVLIIFTRDKISSTVITSSQATVSIGWLTDDRASYRILQKGTLKQLLLLCVCILCNDFVFNVQCGLTHM